MEGGDIINKGRTLLTLTGIAAVLFIASVVYSMTVGNDPYRHHTGIGEVIDISPDDESLAFSYYDQGKESIHIGNLRNGSTEQITSPETENHSQPKFTPDGEGIYYISTGKDRIQTLHLMPEPGAEPVQLTEPDMHVFDAVMAPAGGTVYYIAMPAEDLLAPEGEKENFRDLHRIGIDGADHEQLTDKDALDMSALNISNDGGTLYYTDITAGLPIRAYDIAADEDILYDGAQPSGEPYNTSFSPDGEEVAYTSQAGQSEAGIFIYELFLMDRGSGEAEQLTDYGASVTSPAFFHDKDQIALLAQPDWPGEPAAYELMTVTSDGTRAPVEMLLPEPEGGIQPDAALDRLVNPGTLTLLYLSMSGLGVAYAHLHGRTYLPVILSFGLAAIVLAGSIISAFNDPWMGIGLMMVAVWLLVCTLVLMLFAFIYKRLARRVSTAPDREVKK